MKGALLLALALVAGACSGPSAYEQDVARWTRSVESYEHMESRVFVKATLKTEPFVKSYAKEYARAYALTGEERERVEEAELATAGDELVVIVALFTSKPEWDHLNPQRGIWSLILEGTGGRRVRPKNVRRLDKRDPAWPRLYPHAEHHDSLWEVRFERKDAEGRPLAESGEKVTFIVAGAPAKVSVRWKLP